MILGLDKVRFLINNSTPPLISNLSNRELVNPEGTGIDIRVGKFYKIVEDENGYLENDGNRERRTPSVINITKYKDEMLERDQSFLTMNYLDYYLIETIEQFAIPLNIAGLIFPRTTLFRSGVQLFSSLVAPGYGAQEGGSTLTFGLINMSKSQFRIQAGARIAQIVFIEIEGTTTPYRGQWQDNHGKVSTDIEIQK